VHQMNHVLHGGQDPTSPFAAMRGDKLVMQPCVKLLTWDTCLKLLPAVPSQAKDTIWCLFIGRVPFLFPKSVVSKH